LTSVNVGEGTRAGMARPPARPLTSRVLPAPRSPESAMTSPLRASRPQLSPSASVSAGLCEMFVTMDGQRPNAVPVAQMDSFARGDLADAGKGNFGELLFPGIEQGDCVAGRPREQQFKILAIAQ